MTKPNAHEFQTKYLDRLKPVWYDEIASMSDIWQDYMYHVPRKGGAVPEQVLTQTYCVSDTLDRLLSVWTHLTGEQKEFLYFDQPEDVELDETVHLPCASLMAAEALVALLNDAGTAEEAVQAMDIPEQPEKKEEQKEVFMTSVRVRSTSKPGTEYTVQMNNLSREIVSCSCMDHKIRGNNCKHMKLVDKSRTFYGLPKAIK